MKKQKPSAVLMRNGNGNGQSENIGLSNGPMKQKEERLVSGLESLPKSILAISILCSSFSLESQPALIHQLNGIMSCKTGESSWERYVQS